ncbi:MULTISPECIES: ribokinase [unclassified Salinibacterium]|uniref:ribokinase n=1 Tax=unclassified Salinibacterium TaxID=2632331 RepID=UPI00143D5CB0|nr:MULTISPECIES: ribokinase [unclassified Salinibacterium]
MGSSNLDLVVRVPRLPRGGETVAASPVARHPGGKGANQAVAIARLGAPVTLLSAIGDDEAGRTLRASAGVAGVDGSNLVVLPQHPSGVAFITVDDSSENMIVVSPGANSGLLPAHLEAREALFERAAVVGVSLEIPIETAQSACALARWHGATVVLNASPLTEDAHPLLGQCDVLVVNEHECAAITGVADDDPDALAAALGGLGVRRAVVTRGARGSLVLEHLDTQQATASVVEAHAVEAVDTTGCGDAFAGALMARLARGDGLRDAAAAASLVAAYAATREGAQASYPTAEQLWDFAQR